jgi:DNA segregation ATPase FtsK/SpoIIIE-like protein
LDDEQLQLFLLDATLTSDQRSLAVGWLLRYGRQLAGLQLPVTSRSLVQALLGGPGFGSNLQHLDIQGTNTLVGLLAAKVQLPRLQRLAACLSQHAKWKVDKDVVIVSASSQAAGKLHPLQQFCPQLIDLRLSLSGLGGGAAEEAMFESVDTLLPGLLPPTLQQLYLGDEWSVDDQATLQPHVALVHLTGLQHLELFNFEVQDPATLLALPRQCSLCLNECTGGGEVARPDCWVPLRHRLTALEVLCRHITGDCRAVGELTRLTSLSLDLRHHSSAERGPGSAMSRLIALQQLELYGNVGPEMLAVGEVLQHVRSISSLKRLSLFPDNYSSRELLNATGALTQLTFLCLHSDEPVEAGMHAILQQQQAAADEQQAAHQLQQQQQPTQEVAVADPAASGAPASAAQAPALQGRERGPLQALQHLVGLRKLQLSGGHLLSHPTSWLCHLTQLTLLGVEFFIEQVPEIEWLQPAAQQPQQQQQPLAGDVQHMAAQQQQQQQQQQPAGDGAQVSEDEGDQQSADVSEQSMEDSEQSTSSYEPSDSDTDHEQHEEDRACCVAATAQCVQHSRPSSLKQLMLFIEDVPACNVVPSPLLGVSVHVRDFQWDLWKLECQGRRPMQPCPHLPGVWEVV